MATLTAPSATKNVASIPVTFAVVEACADVLASSAPKMPSKSPIESNTTAPFPCCRRSTGNNRRSNTTRQSPIAAVASLIPMPENGMASR